MLLDQFSTLITQLLVHYLPIDDVSLRVTVSMALIPIVYQLLKYIVEKSAVFFSRRLNLKDNYIIIERSNRCYEEFMKYMYTKFANETKGCKIIDKNGMVNMLIDELTKGELYDIHDNIKINISFDSTTKNSSSTEKNSKENLSSKDLILKTSGNIKILDEYLKKIIKDINSSKNKDVNMFKLKVSGNAKKERIIEWTRNKFTTNKTIANTIVTDEVKKLYYDDMKQFINKKEYYCKKGLPYKRGYILHGEPGCGKTSLIKAAAHDYNLPVFIVDISILQDNSELLAAVNELNYHINPDESYLLVFEDLDRTQLFDNTYDYDHKSKKNKITEDCILNILDGIDESQGRITVVTTNDLVKIKRFRSLIRPGRIDMTVHLTYCTIDQIIHFLKFYFEEEPLIDKSQFTNTNYITPAQLIQIIYLLNDSKKVIMLLNKISDFTNVDIEKEIFNINSDGNDNKNLEQDDNKAGQVSLAKIKSVGRVSRPSQKYKTRRLKRRGLNKFNYLINAKKKRIQILEQSIDTNNEISKLKLECYKIELKINELNRNQFINERKIKGYNVYKTDKKSNIVDFSAPIVPPGTSPFPAPILKYDESLDVNRGYETNSSFSYDSDSDSN